ncbi:hypothetical protein EDC01DRAFT_633518 [Geopyxis carbonaria]|nr:hypothetical protein EDC01DRAFT_633518 [Geopyxis carbonaria]
MTSSNVSSQTSQTSQPQTEHSSMAHDDEAPVYSYDDGDTVYLVPRGEQTPAPTPAPALSVQPTPPPTSASSLPPSPILPPPPPPSPVLPACRSLSPLLGTWTLIGSASSTSSLASLSSTPSSQPDPSVQVLDLDRRDFLPRGLVRQGQGNGHMRWAREWAVARTVAKLNCGCELAAAEGAEGVEGVEGAEAVEGVD